MSSVAVVWTSTVPSNGYTLGASTQPFSSPGFSGAVIISSITADQNTTGLTDPGLSANTTYYLEAGTIYTSSPTVYTSTNTPLVAVTLSSQVTGIVLSQVSTTTFQLSWNSVGAGNAIGYKVVVSTSANFIPPMITTGTFGVAATSIAIAGIAPSTTYFIEVGSLNWNFSPNFASSISTVTLAGGGLPAPTGLTGFSPTPTSINWSWSIVGGATQYNLYLASSTATLVVSTTTNAWSETGLSANIPVGLVVSALGGGQQSPLSASATTFTLANVPGVPVVNSVSSTTLAITWGPAGNPGYTPYEVSIANDGAFATNLSTPIPFTNNLTANTTNILGLIPGTNYFVRIRAQNGNGVTSIFSPSVSTVTLGSGGGGGSGLGSVAIVPATVQEGGVVTTTFTFTVPTVSMNTGGQLEIISPPYWGPPPQVSGPAQDDYVMATTTGPATLMLTPITASTASIVMVRVQSGFLASGTQIIVVFHNIHPTCPPPNQSQAAWEIKTAMTGSTALADIQTQPTQSYVTGTAQWLGFNPPNTLTVAVNQPSSAITLQSNDNCGRSVAVTAPVTVNLQGFINNQTTTDSGAQFSNSSSFASPITSVVLPSGNSNIAFYYMTSSTGSLWIQGSYPSLNFAGNQQTWRSVDSLATPFSFSSVSVDTGVPLSGQAAVTISPDGSGINNFAYIRFIPSDNTTQWHIAISSNNFQTLVFEQYGTGTPQGQISWDGRIDIFNGGPTNGPPPVAPNGTYAVKLEVIGLASSANTSLSVVLNTAQISGNVTVSNVAVAGAQITAQGANGPGYSSTLSDASGNYVLLGLRAGASYNLYANYISTTNQSVVAGQKPNIPAGTSNVNFSLTTPNVIRVAAVAPSTSAATVFGNLNVHSSDYSNNYFGNLRLLPGTTTTDNGDPVNPSTWTYFYVPLGNYTVQINMQGFGASAVTVTNSSDVVINLQKQANVYGWIILPSPVSYPTWAPVNGTVSGSNVPTIWGGAFFNVGQSSAIYSIFGVPAGNYTFVAQVNGYVPGVLTNVAITTSDSGNPVTGGTDFPALGTGGSISGTITIGPDTSALPTPLNLFLNAFSPTLGFNVSTQVQLSTSTSPTSASYQIGGLPDGTYQMFAPFLQGYDPNSFGPQSVTVNGGIGHANFTLTQETGKISGQVILPNGNIDYSQVHISLQGPISLETDLANANVLISHLGTGFYNLTAIYKTTGAQAHSTVNLTNGQTATVVLDLSAPTYKISGTVSVQSGFSMTGSSGSLVTINTISGLLANATSQNLYIGGTAGGPGTAGGGLNCSQTTPISTTTARVEAFPKSFNSFGDSNRSGFTNCFGIGQYNFSVIDSSGNYSIPNLSPGVWEVDVYPYFDGGQAPDAAVLQQFITVTAASVSGVNFALTGGNAVSGTVSLPAGVTDNRQFNVQILDNLGNSVQTTFLQVGSPASLASSADYKFTNLPAGQYSLLIQDFGSFDPNLGQNVVKYVASPVQFTINGTDLTGINVAMGRAARIVGKLGIQMANADGSTTLTLITSNNTNLLPSGFMISAQADPWIPGGSRGANQNGTGPSIDANNQFSIDGLTPGTYDVTFQQNSFGISVQASGGLNLAAYTQGSVVITAGQTLDLGTIVLKPGISLSGTVTDTSGNPLSNISVRATPSNSQHGQNSIQVTTDANGNFTLTGLSSDLKIYDIVAAPRPGPGDPTPPVAYGQVSRLAIDVTQTPAPTLNFTLATATAQFTGRIITVDGGSLSFPDSKQLGFPAAAIFLHLQGDTSEDNPLGIEIATNLDGSFTFGQLVAGVYDLTVESLGYQPYKLIGLTLSNGATQNLGTITLQRGAELDATLARPDGSLVNTGQVQTVVAVSPDLSSIIFGQVNEDANTGNILSIKFSGFLTSPQTYNVLLFDDQNNITTPPEGRGLVFISSSDVISRSLTYEPSAPFAYANAKRAGSIGTAVTITYYLSRPLRNRGDDQNLSLFFTIVSGQGSLTNLAISGDRRQVTAIYNPAAGEQNATITFSAHTVDIDPSTGIEFVLSKTIALLLGQKATADNNINSALGGSLSLSNSNDPSNVTILGNTLLNTDGSAADATTSFDFTLTATDDINSIAGVRAGARSAALTSLINYGAAAYVGEAYQAMTVARSQATVNPLSSFYSILLPAGLSHSLNQTALLTLNYSSTADPTQINVYFFDGTRYIIQNSGRTVDPLNHTITVGVSHFSTFVVLQNSTPVIEVTGGSTSGGAIEVFNFPNPFNLQTKTETLTHGGTTASMSTDGTIIRYVIPSSMVGPAVIDIYDVVGEKVQSIDLGTPSGGTFNYVTWDGRNKSGNKVASGIYIGILKVNGNKAFFKMAVIK